MDPFPLEQLIGTGTVQPGERPRKFQKLFFVAHSFRSFNGIIQQNAYGILSVRSPRYESISILCYSEKIVKLFRKIFTF